jgi:hypothetical protein
MDEAERIEICRALAVSHMWGQGGVASVFLDELGKRLPCLPTWSDLYSAHVKESRREHLGVITDEDELRRRLRDGYFLTNWDDDGCSLFRAPHFGGGLSQYVSKELAEKYKRSF